MDKHIANNKNNPINYEQTQKERNNIIICETLERLCEEYLPNLDTPLNFICEHIQEEIEEYNADDIRETLHDNGFFEEEIISSIDTFLQYIRSNEHYVNTGHLVRHMLALVFPTIIVTVVRVVRTDPDFVEELFQLIMSRRDHLSDIVQTRPNAIGISTMYAQFINDIREQVDNDTLSTGHTANVEVGGMRVNIDLRDI